MVVNGITYLQEYYVQDTREEYCGYVAYMRDLLLPHFDKEMTAASVRIGKALQDLFEAHQKKVESLKGEARDSEKQKYLLHKLALWKETFQELNKLLHRKKYFKADIYQQ